MLTGHLLKTTSLDETNKSPPTATERNTEHGARGQGQRGEGGRADRAPPLLRRVLTTVLLSVRGAACSPNVLDQPCLLLRGGPAGPILGPSPQQSHTAPGHQLRASDGPVAIGGHAALQPWSGLVSRKRFPHLSTSEDENTCMVAAGIPSGLRVRGQTAAPHKGPWVPLIPLGAPDPPGLQTRAHLPSLALRLER